MFTIEAASAFGDETVSRVRPHDTVIVQGGGGTVQRVPFNVPGFGALGTLTEDDKNKLAERVKNASTAFFGSDVRSILAAIPDAADRSDVAVKAISLGGDATSINNALASVTSSIEFKKAFNVPLPLRIFWVAAAIASTGAGVYHGYKRNNSIGWALWWGLMGAIAPIVTPAIAFAQGFGKPARNGLGRTQMRGARTFGGTHTNTKHHRRNKVR
jgi:hypothetical protein